MIPREAYGLKLSYAVPNIEEEGTLIHVRIKIPTILNWSRTPQSRFFFLQKTLDMSIDGRDPHTIIIIIL